MKQTKKITFLFRLKRLKKKIFTSKEQKQQEINEKKRLQEIAEKEEIKNRKLFYQTFIKKDDLCFDVGANMGNRISSFLEIGAKVVAVEPQESCYTYLKQEFGDTIEIVPKGLGAEESIKDFHVSNVSTISSFSNEWINAVKKTRFKGYNWDKIVQVEMTTLDKLILKYGQPVFIKIDVEGYELDVLKGLTKPVKMISFEYTVPEQLNKVIECLDEIEKNDANIECNYSVDESMALALPIWKSVSEIKKHILSYMFIETEFGDIYVRLKK